MADKPITFSAPMVRALLAGTKTQTRRLVSKPEYYGCPTGDCPHNHQAECNAAMAGLVNEIARFKVGDRVYVREHWKTAVCNDDSAPRDLSKNSPVWYLANGVTRHNFDIPMGRHRQAMHMPRWASRMWLEITDVRVQRLQDISEADAIAEGISLYVDGWHFEPNAEPFVRLVGASAIGMYQWLWDSLHAELGTTWADNPWIVAHSFVVHHGNIDQSEHNSFPSIGEER